MDVHGADIFINFCEDAINNFDGAVDKFLVRVGLKFLRAVKLRSPVDTGVLRRNWRMTKEARDVLITNNTKYAIMVNSGHRTVGGGYVEGKYMVENTVQEIKDSLQDEFNSFLNDLWGGS